MTSPPPIRKPPQLPEQKPDQPGFPHHWVAIGLAIGVIILILALLPMIRAGGTNGRVADQQGPAEPAPEQSVDDSEEEPVRSSEDDDEIEIESIVDETDQDPKINEEKPASVTEAEEEAEEEAETETEIEEELPSLTDSSESPHTVGSFGRPNPNAPSQQKMGRTGGGGGGSGEDLEGALKAAGAGEGDIQFSLGWGDVNDLDLHVQTPNGQVINFRAPNSRDGGILDLDANAGRHRSRVPVENIYWATGTAPEGVYKVLVHYYAYQGGPRETPLTLRIKIKGKPAEVYSKRITPQMVTVGIFEIKFKR